MSTPARPIVKAFLPLLGLCTLSIVIPLYTTLARGATFFVAHNAGPGQILQFSLAVFILPPLIFWLVCAALHKLAPTIGAVVIRAILALLAAALLTNALKPDSLLILASILVTVGAVLYVLLGRAGVLLDFFRYVGLVSLFAPLVFLFLSPVRVLLDSSGDHSFKGAGGRINPIIMLVLDEISLNSLLDSNGDIDAGRLPNFARLAQLSSWYSNATTASSLTHRAAPALLTGRHVDEGTLPVYQHFQQNLFTMLGSSHQIQAVETITRLCPQRICKADKPDAEESASGDMYRDAGVVLLHSVLAKSIAAQHLPSIAGRWGGFNPDETSDETHEGEGGFFDLQSNKGNQFKGFVSTLKTLGAGELSYFHLALPHSPWFYLPDGSFYNGSEIPGRATTQYAWKDNLFLVEQGMLRYLLQVEYVDFLLGSLLDNLEQNERFNETLLVVVADHGVAFAANENFRSTAAATLSDVALVPLFIKYPGQTTPRRETKPVQTVDIFPTIMDVMGLPLSEPVDGQSLLSKSWRPAVRSLLETELGNIDFEQLLSTATPGATFRGRLVDGHSVLNYMAQGAGQRHFGAHISELAIAGNSGASVELDYPNWYANVSLESGFLPSRLTATVAGAVTPQDFLITVNDVVAGSGISIAGGEKLSILIDPRMLEQGANQIGALLVTDDAKILRVGIKNRLNRYDLSFDESGVLQGVSLQERHWVSDSDSSIRFQAEESKGSVVASVVGWAYESVSRQSAEAILLLKEDAVFTDAFRSVLNPFAAPNAGLAEDEEIGFIIETGPAGARRIVGLSLVFLFADGSFRHAPL